MENHQSPDPDAFTRDLMNLAAQLDSFGKTVPTPATVETVEVEEHEKEYVIVRR